MIRNVPVRESGAYRKKRCFCDGVLWRTGRCAGDEGVPSQDAALVLQGVLPGAVDCTDCRTCCRCVLISVLNQIM